MMMRILVADKDPAVLSLVTARLEPRGYEVGVVTDSEKALRLLNQYQFDLAMISADMERIGGQFLVEKIRFQNHLAALPIIMMTTQDKISDLLMTHERGFDDFLIKPFNPLVLQLRVSLNISRFRVRSEANALTQLPGNITIEKIIREKIEREDKFAVLYIDINQFKAFNDRYGFGKGDDVIRQTAKILIQTRDKISADGDCFIGHIGGDDFIVVLPSDKDEEFARNFITEFDRIMPTYYNRADQERGYVHVKNRKGDGESFPLMSCSVASCTNAHRAYTSMGEIAQDAAEVKAFLKTQTGSSFLRDRRSSPIEKLDAAADILTPKQEPGRKNGKMVDPLGKILLNAGLIDEEQLAKAIHRHVRTGQRLGQTLISMNLVRSSDVGRMLEKKLNVPYLSLTDCSPSRDALRLFTLEFMKSHRVVPVEIEENHLKLAMCDPFDIKTLDAIERISGLKPVPCLALEDEFENFIETKFTESAAEQKFG